jgi:hypothetical protein
VQFDQSVVYLGTPGANENCPVKGVGDTTQALLIQPAAGLAAPSSVNDPVDDRITVQDAGIQVTASYGSDPAQVQQILASASLPAPVDRTPMPAVEAASPTVVSPTNGSGKGFDTCTAPSSGNMTAWSNDSPYNTVGIYIGGPEEACSQPNLTASWVNAQYAAGWSFIPIYVGPQAEYGQLTSPASQGTAAAQAAVSDAESLGIGPGAMLYDDMEAYPSSDNSAVISFTSAWTIELHRHQYESGMYSSSDSGVSALAGSFSDGSQAAPDVIYDALWNGEANTSDPNIPSGDWAYHQRVHQYSGGVNQTYGGYTLNIDQDDLDVVQPYDKAKPAATVDSAGSASAGTVRVFVRGGDLALYETDLPVGGPWSSYTDLGGMWPYDPAVLAESNGNTQVFAVGTTGNLYVDTYSGGIWSGWDNLGGSNQGTPTVLQDSSGTVWVFVRGAKGALWEDSGPSGASWSGLTSLGGTWANDATALAESGGNIQLFAVGTTGNLYADTLSGATWSGWGNLGGSNQGVPAVVQETSGNVLVFVRGAEGALWEDSGPSGAPWSGLTDLGGIWRDNPAALVGSGGDLWVFATGITANFYYDEMKSGATTWNGWTSLGGAVTGTPSAVQDNSTTIRVYVRGTNGSLYEAYSSPSWTIDDRNGSLY